MRHQRNGLSPYASRPGITTSTVTRLEISEADELASLIPGHITVIPHSAVESEGASYGVIAIRCFGAVLIKIPPKYTMMLPYENC